MEHAKSHLVFPFFLVLLTICPNCDPNDHPVQMVNSLTHFVTHPVPVGCMVNSLAACQHLTHDGGDDDDDGGAEHDGGISLDVASWRACGGTS